MRILKKNVHLGLSEEVKAGNVVGDNCPMESLKELIRIINGKQQ